MAVDESVQVKSRRDAEKEIWPFVKPNIDLSTPSGRASYMQYYRDYQKNLHEQLKTNSARVNYLLFRIDMLGEEAQNLLSMEMSFRKKGQKR